MLADAHAPQNHRTFGFGEFARHFAQRLGRNAADRRHCLRAVGLDIFTQGLVVADAVANERLVRQALVNHGVDQRVEHGHIGIGLELQGAPGMFANLGDARVGQHNLRSAFGGVFHPGCGHRMVRRRVGADDENHAGVLNIVDLVADRARAHALKQCGHAGRMAQTRAVVHVVAAKAGAHQLLKQIGLLIAAFGRTKAGQGFFAVRIAQAAECLAAESQRLFPAGFTKNFRPVGRVAVKLV